MKKNKQLDKAQDGTQVTAPSPTFSLDQSFMEKKYGGYKPSLFDSDPVRYSSRGRFSTRPPAEVSSNSTENMLNYLSAPGDKGFSPEINTLDEFAEARTGRYENYLPGYNMEEAEALGQSTASKAFNGITKGLGLMGTTFLNSTANLVYGAIKWGQTGEFSSFYDNDFTRSLDKFNRGLEDSMPNYYTQAERNADWYSPDYFFTGNFLWDGVVKNLGFAAGAALSGAAYTAALKAIPITSRLFAAGKGAETLAATEAGLASNTGKVSSTYGRLLELNKQFTSGYNSMNAGGRAVVAGLATTGEASIEAMHNLHELEETLTKDFIDANGYYPSSSEMKNIKEAAKGAGNKTFLANFALLTATNYIQFPKILGSTYKGEKNVANNIIGDLSSLVNRNKNILASEAGDVVKEGGEYVIKKSKYPKLATLGRAIKNPYLFSYSEAFEEVGQFTAATATKDYYEKKSKGDAASWLESFGVGIKEGMLSDEGAKNALIGGLSGAIMLGPGKFRAAARKKRDTQNFVSALNSSDLGTAFSSFTKETYDSLERSTVLQQERVAAIKEGRILDSKDLEADYIINYLTPRIKYGRLDLVTADINEYRKLASTAEGFAQLQAEGKALQTDTAESYLKRLDNFEQSANNLDTLWQSINLRYSALKDEEGNPLYSSDVVNKMIYTASKIADYDLRIPEITQDLMSAGVDVAGLTKGLLEGNLDEFNKAYEQIQNLNTVSKNELTEKLKDVSELILRRQEFFNTYEDIKANPLNFREAKVADETKAPDSVETIRVKTKKGEKDIEIGTEYFAGKGVDYTEETLASPIPISKFSVLGVSENGKLKIQNLDTGVESEISIEEFENLKVGKVSSLKNNSTANYFYEHRNEIFKFNFGKKRGGPRSGRIEYQDGKLYFVYKTKGSDKTTKVETTQAEVKQKVSKLEKRINRAKSMFANAKTGAEKAEALILFLNNAHHTTESVNEEDMAWFNNAKKEVEADGYIIDSEIGRKISENETVEFGLQRESDSIPKGTIIVNYITRPRRLVDGKQVQNAKYDVLIGTGTTEERDKLLQEFEDAENALDPKDLEGTRGRYDAAKKALKEYDDANFTKPGAEANLKKELTTYKKAKPKAKTKVSNSNIKKIQIYRRHLETKEGFDRSILYREGTVENQNQKSARQLFLSAKEIAQEEATLAQNRETRLEIISQLGEEAQENLIETNKKIDKAKEDLTKVKEDLESIQKMKESGPTGPKIKLNFSKATRSFTRAINKLQAMQNDLNEIINNSEQERNELEFNIAYFQDFTNEIIILPEDTGEFMEELKDQVSLLVDNSKNLKNAIVAAKKAAKQAESTIKSVTKVFRSALKSTYIIDEDYSQYLNELLDQVAAGENLEVTWPLLKQELANFALTTNLSIEANINEPGLIKAITDLQKLQKDLADMNSEYTARKIILDRYQKIRDEFKAEQAAEEKLQVKLKAVMNTADKGTPIVQTEKGYEPESKKPLDVLSKATTFRDTRKGEELTPDEFRANQFGIDLDSFDNRKKIRGLYITKEIENDLLPGLVERALQDSEGNEERTKELIEKYESSVIVMVMVDENGSLVGVDGKPIPEGQPLLDNAIFQVIPEEGFNNGEMFRNDTPQDTKDFIIKEYKKFRDNILAQKTLGVPFKVSASFGVSQNVQDTSRTSVKDAGLITDSDLEKEILLNVPTTNKTIDKGTTQYTSPLGSVYLELKNGLVKLKNRLHTSKDASAIYDSILQLSKNLLDANEGIESDSSIRILNFLRGVTYWGIPANNAGNNSAFFEKDKDGKLMLRLSDKGITFRFTPSALQLNKDTIIQTLESMYNNVNKSKTKDINEKFEQIVSISPEGKIKSIVWPNYQSYLLSSKGREDFELPLYTIMKPKVEGETNREGVYFVNNSTADTFKIPEPKTQAANIPIKKSANYVVDGKTINTYTSPTSGKKILFTVNGFGGVISNENIEILPGADRNSVKATDDQIKTSIVYSMAPEVAKENAQKSYTESIAPKAPAQPKKQTSRVATIKRNLVDLETPITEFEPAVQELFNSPNPTVELYENTVANYEYDLEAELSPNLRKSIEAMLRDVKKSFTISQPTSDVEVVTYKGTKYSVDFNVGSGTITNLKTGKVLEGGVTSPVGQAVVDLAIDQQDSAEQASKVESNEVIGTPVERSKAETELDELQNLINQSKSDINLGENLIREDIDIDLSKFDSADVKELEEKGYSKEKIKDILIKKCND